MMSLKDHPVLVSLGALGTLVAILWTGWQWRDKIAGRPAFEASKVSGAFFLPELPEPGYSWKDQQFGTHMAFVEATIAVPTTMPFRKVSHDLMQSSEPYSSDKVDAELTEMRRGRRDPTGPTVDFPEFTGKPPTEVSIDDFRKYTTFILVRFRNVGGATAEDVDLSLPAEGIYQTVDFLTDKTIDGPKYFSKSIPIGVVKMRDKLSVRIWSANFTNADPTERDSVYLNWKGGTQEVKEEKSNWQINALFAAVIAMAAGATWIAARASMAIQLRRLLTDLEAANHRAADIENERLRRELAFMLEDSSTMSQDEPHPP